MVIPQCSFDLHFSNNEQCWAFSHVFVDHLYVFFGEISVLVFCPFLIGLLVFLMLSCMSCLYILETNPLSFASFANIFYHSDNCLFVLFMVSFAVQKFLSFIRSHLFIFAFIFITLSSQSKRFLLQFMSKNVLPIFFPMSFIESHLTFRSLIHF